MTRQSRESLQLGSFRLDRVIAAGGMSEVWRGTHLRTGQPVAIKIMRSDFTSSTTWRDAFQAEVRAVAALSHPHIVEVHDYGTVPESVSARAPDLRRGTPYLVMDYLEGGTLDAQQVGSWELTADILHALLDALAHAHSHGVIHRDIKQENVLWTSRRAGLRLTDFGIAHLLHVERRGTPNFDGGTPTNMAPEQFTGDWREFGPWTDLYGVGCMAWRLITGHPPFPHTEWSRLAVAHAMQPLPQFVPRFRVPRRTENWLHRLLQKSPKHRFQCAADASWNLNHLGTLNGPRDPRSQDNPSLEIQTVTLPWSPNLPSPTSRITEPFRPQTTGGTMGKPLAIQRPPFPATWQREDASTSGRLTGTGLGLFGLREPPIIGRIAERDVMWRLLREVHAEGTPRLLLLNGPAGCGKSRLADWLTRQASSVGAAIPIRVQHAELPSPHDGMAPALARHFGLTELEAGQRTSRIREALLGMGIFDSDHVEALDALTRPAPPSSGSSRHVQFSNAMERHALVHQTLKAISGDRPIVLWFDDVHWGLQSLALVRHLLEEAACPVLMVLTCRADILEDRPSEQAALMELLGVEGANAVPLGLLDASSMNHLLRETMGLSVALARRLQRRVAGNPLFANQLVGEWITRDLLVQGIDGFDLKVGSVVQLPDDLHAMWTERVDRLLQDRPPEWRRAMAVAAALGLDVDPTEWRDACQALGFAIPDGLLEALLRACLARSTQAGWRFGHGLLRESLERVARETDAWIEVNLCCARLMGHKNQSARVGRHLFAADHWDEAITPLLEGAHQRFLTSELAECEALLSLADDALKLADIPRGDRRRGELLLLRSRLHKDLGEDAYSFHGAQQARDFAEQHGWPELQARASMRVGYVLRDRPDIAGARKEFKGALARLQSLARPDLVAECQLELARCATLSGELDLALTLNSEARATWALLDQPKLGLARCLLNLAETLTLQGTRLREASRHFRAARARFRDAGSRFGEVTCLNGEAELARMQGDLEAAEAGYARAAELTERLGRGDAAIMRLNLSICMMERGLYVEAQRTLKGIRKRLKRQHRSGLVGVADALSLCGLARRERWDHWEDTVNSARTRLESSGFVDRDVARFSEIAGDLARDAGRPEEAELAWELALHQWDALGDEARVLALEAKDAYAN